MQAASVSASLRHGMTIETCTSECGRAPLGFAGRCAVSMQQEPNAVSLGTKEMTPTDRLSRTGTCLAACSCPLERFPRGHRQQYVGTRARAIPKVSYPPTDM